MWNTPTEAEQTTRNGWTAFGVALLLFVVIVLSNLLMLRPRLTDRFDAWSTKVMQAELTAKMWYGDFLPFGTVRQLEWEQILKTLTARDAPLGALLRAVILIHDRASILGQQTAQQRIGELLRRMPEAPTRFSPEQKQAVLQWCTAIYGQRRAASSAEEKERFRQAIEQANLGWMRLLAMKHLELAAGDADAARRWDTRAREQANRLQRTLVGIFGVVVLLLLSGIGAWMGYALWKGTARSRQPSVPVLATRHVSAVMWGLVTYFAATYFGGWMAGMFTRTLSPSTPALVILVLLTQVATGGAALWVLNRQLRQHGISWRDIGLAWDSLPAQLAWGLGAYVATVPILLVTLVLVQVVLPNIPSPAHPIAGIASAENPAWVTAMLFLVAAVFAPLFEEILFRGVLLNALWAQTGSKWVAIIGSAFVFSVLHPQLYLGWMAVFVIGVMLGGLFVERRSLVPCVWMHALNNTVALVATQLLRIGG